ncbi:MAG: DNA repair protein RecN [Sphingomonadaceae bacterium]
MLLALAIRDLVLIDQVALELAPGLTVLTGETGAGKSILLDGLGLALGERADAGLVRSGAAQAVASATFAVPPGHPALNLLAEQAIEPGEVIVCRRVVKADGGSRAFVNDTPVSAGALRALASLLVEVHGQHDERGLLAPRGHLALLDAFAGLDAAAVAAAWTARSDAEAALADARHQREADARDRDWLEHGLAELAALAPQPGEEAELADQRRRLQEGARLAEALDSIDAHVSASEGALGQLRQAARRLERLAASEPELAEALAAIDRMLVEGDCVEAALAAARRRATVSPEEAEAAEARLFELRALARKHRVTPDELPQLLQSLEARLAALQSRDGEVARLEARVRDARAAHEAACTALAGARREAAKRLDAAVNAELPALRLEAARFRTRIEPAEPGPTGADRVEFEVATNPGAPFGPLTKIASGGELSRFVLALKVALASTGTAGTLIFDEIDRGVGGATATAIGERLARVAEGAQVLVVTHSPQVAACGAQHLRISKESGTTRVALLAPDMRTEELARMLSGTHVTDEARAQARRLIAGREQPCPIAAIS